MKTEQRRVARCLSTSVTVSSIFMNSLGECDFIKLEQNELNETH